MNCLVCLQNVGDKCFNLFENEQFKCNNAAEIIGKHLWFQPAPHSSLTQQICFVCWNIIDSFNKFYIQVEAAHKKLDNVDIPQINIKSEIDYPDEERIDFMDETLPKNGSIAIKLHNATKERNKSDVVEGKRNSITKKKPKVTSVDIDLKINKFMILSCNICSKPLKNFSALRVHFRNEHDRSGYAICCNKKFFKRCRLLDHIDTHLNPDIFKCQDCGKVFNSREYLQLHIKNLHDKEKTIFQCLQCPKKFAWKTMLDAHKYIHTPKENWNIKCEECEKTFATKYFLAAHKHSVHYSKNNLKICHICGKNVSNKMFKRHQKTHSGIDEPRVQCEICGTWLKNERYLKIHLENHQESAVDHICTVCGKNSPNRRALAKHVRDTHTENRTHKCNICDKSFKRRLLLTQHITTHTGEFLYNCSYCPKSFTYDSTFHVHKKKEHPVEFEAERLKRGIKLNTKKSNQGKCAIINVNKNTKIKAEEISKSSELFQNNDNIVE